nr:transporter substrate-binding domain-containing protein [uncultured Pseudodesulfovibrio sp.]
MAYERLSFFCTVLVLTFCIMVGTGNARGVTVGIAFSMPPYVIRDNNTGLEVDIIRESFAVAGMDAEFQYLPARRLSVALADGIVDCVASNVAFNISRETGLETFDSEVTLFYQNYAVSMESSGYAIRSIEDLKDKMVLGFSNAAKYLGPEYLAMTTGNKKYTELSDQALQVRMLYSGRTQVVISDKRIFLYWRKMLLQMPIAEIIDLNQGIQFFKIFPPAPRHLSFRDNELRDAFDKGLHILRKSGVYKAITQRYTGVERE